MRWFTDAAYSGEVDWDEMLRRYSAHLRQIASLLPPDLDALATEPRLNLHDAEIREVVIDEADRVTIVVNAGDLQLGYRELTLDFAGARIVPDNLQALAYAVGARFETGHWGSTVTVIRAQEVDVLPDGGFVLRLRLWPFYAFAIEFSGLQLTEAPSHGRNGMPGIFRLATDP